MKKGFTIIEVAIFLAISGAVFASVMGIFSANVARHRYQDSLNDIIETVRNTYASTINVENARIKQEESSYFCSISSAFKGDSLSINSRETDINDNYPGRTRCAIYGQLITFGEQNQSIIHRYDIIGTANTDNINPDGNDDVLSALRSVGANIATITQTNSSATTCRAGLAGTSSSKEPVWLARLENQTSDHTLYKGAIMIVRSPISGTIRTYFYSDTGDLSKPNKTTFEIQNWLSEHKDEQTCNSFYSDSDYFLGQAIKDGKMLLGDEKNDGIKFCVGSDQTWAYGDLRRAIQIHANGSTESAVELLTERDSSILCQK